MAIAGTLEIQMLANMARLQSDMTQAKGMVGGAMGSIEKAVASAKSALGSLGIGLGVGYFVSLIKGSIDAADHLKDLSKSTVITVGELAGLKLLANQTGTDLDGLAKGINKMSVEMGKAPEKFRALGITAKTSTEALKQFSDIFNLLPDINQRNALAMSVFGKSWAELAPVLSEGGKKIGEVIEKGAALSGITKQMTDDADEFNDKLAELTQTGGLLTRQIGPLLPLLNALADDMITLQNETQGSTNSFHPLAEAFRAIIILGGNVAFVLKAIGNDLGGMAAQLNALAHGDFKAFSEINEMIKKDAVDGRAAFDAWEKKMLTVGTTAKGTAEIVVAASGGMTEAQKKAAAAAAAFLGKDNSVKEAAKLAAAELKLYEGSVKSLSDMLGKLNEQTESEKLAFEEYGKNVAMADGTIVHLTGSLEKLTPAHKAMLVILAAEIDARKQAIEVSKSWVAAIDAEIAVQEKLNSMQADSNLADSQTVQNLQFEIDLIGKTTAQQQLLTAARQIDLDLQNKLLEASKTVGVTPESLAEITAVLTAAAERQKAIIAGMLIDKNGKDKALAEWNNFGNQISDSLTKAFGKAGKAAGDMFKEYANGIKNQKQIDGDYAASADKHGSHSAAQAEKYANETTQNTLTQYGSMAGAAASYFDQQSTAYKVLHGIEEVMFAAKLAMQIEAMVMDTTVTGTSVINSGIRATADGIAAFAKTLASVPFPYNLAAGAVVIAALAAAGVAIFGGGGGGGGGATGVAMGQSAADNQKFQGAGSVLGDRTAMSDSLLQSIQEIEKTDKLGLTNSHSMLRALYAIRDSLSGAATAIAGSVGLLGGPQDIKGLGIQSSPGFLGMFKSSTTLTDQGIQFGQGQTVGGVRTDGLSAQGYSQTHSENSGFFGLFSSSSDKTVLAELPAAVTKSMGLVVLSIADGVESAGKALGIGGKELHDTISAAAVDLNLISLKGLTGQGLTDALNAVFSKYGDTLSATVLPGLEQFQKVGEGYLQTVIRVATQNEYVDHTLKNLGLSLNLTGMDAISARMSLIDLSGGFDKFSESADDYYANFYTDAERTANTVKDLGTEFGALNVVTPKTRAEFRQLVDAQDLTTASGRETVAGLLALSPAFASVTTSIDDIASTMQSWQDKLDVLTGKTTERALALQHDLASTTDETTQSLIRQVYAQEDLKTAADAYMAGQAALNAAYWASITAAEATAAQALSNIKSAYANVQSALAGVGSAVQALADAAKASATTLQTSKDNISNALFAAQDKVASLQKKSADSLQAFTKSIDDFLRTINPATSSTASLQSLKAQLSATGVLAGAGDTDAQGRLIGQAKDVLKAAEASSTSALEYARSEAFVRTTLEGVKRTLGPSVALVETAESALEKAQQDVIQFTALAIATGAKTVKNSETTQGAIERLGTAWQQAWLDDANAQAIYQAALTATSDLHFVTAGTLDALNIALAGYDSANIAFAKSIYDAGVATGEGVDYWVTQLGLSGDAASKFVTALNTAIAGLTHGVVPPASVVTPPDLNGSFAASLYAGNSTAMQYHPDGPDAAGLAYWTNEAALKGFDVAARDFAYSVTDYANSHPLTQYATGTNYLQSDGAFYGHQGETITPKPYVDVESAARKETNALIARLVESNERLEKKVEALQKPADATASATERHKDLAEQVTVGSLSVQTRAADTP